MIETAIQFKCTWTKAKVQKLFESLINADGITELGTSMIFMPDEPIPTEEPEPDPDTFTEMGRISGEDLGHVLGTNKPILTYAETKDGRVAIYYNEAPMYTTLGTVRALPDKIPLDMVRSLSQGKRAALRGFKKFLAGLDASENETSPKYDTGIDPYAPVLTGGARPDTHSSGKVEGDLE